MQKNLNPKYQKKIAAYNYGCAAETQAISYLEKIGWKILEKNFRTKWCEIDCIAFDPLDQALVFVEIRARADPFSLESIRRRKLEHLRLGAEIYSSRISVENMREIRFDFIGIEGGHITKHVRGGFFL